MTRQAEIAALHGHPTVSEDNANIIRLRRRFPEWQIDRCARGFEAFHRVEAPDPRTERVGVRTHLQRPELSMLEEALFVQQTLRGDGPAVA